MPVDPDMWNALCVGTMKSQNFLHHILGWRHRSRLCLSLPLGRENLSKVVDLVGLEGVIPFLPTSPHTSSVEPGVAVRVEPAL